MSKEELRISNQAKKAANATTEVKTTPSRAKKRPVVPASPAKESPPVLAPKLSPIDDDKLINVCLDLHRTTFNSKPPENVDVRTNERTDSEGNESELILSLGET